jgi:hypothetical protein
MMITSYALTSCSSCRCGKATMRAGDRPDLILFRSTLPASWANPSSMVHEHWAPLRYRRPVYISGQQINNTVIIIFRRILDHGPFLNASAHDITLAASHTPNPHLMADSAVLGSSPQVNIELAYHMRDAVIAHCERTANR